MKVILLADVKNVGKKGDVKEVADGYGRNFLIKNKLAVIATDKSMEILKEQQAQQAEDYALKKQQAQQLKEQIEQVKLVFKVKANEDGRINGSVSTSKICEELEKQYHYVVDKKKFKDTENLTKLGHYDVKVELFKEVICQISVDVVAL